MRQVRRIAVLLLLATVLGGAVASYSHSRAEQDAQVRIVHASPDAPAVDIFVDGERVLNDMPFGTVSDYEPLATGRHRLQITTADNSATVVDRRIQLPAGKRTLAVGGEYGENTLQLFRYRDDTRYTQWMSRISAIHLSPDAPAVDITVDNRTTLFSNVQYGNATPYRQISPGNHTLQVRQATPQNNGQVVAAFPVELEPGETYSAFALGYLTPDDEPQQGQPLFLAQALDSADRMQATPPPTQTPSARTPAL